MLNDIIFQEIIITDILIKRIHYNSNLQYALAQWHNFPGDNNHWCFNKTYILYFESSTCFSRRTLQINEDNNNNYSKLLIQWKQE